jgi:hypothetical protein
MKMIQISNENVREEDHRKKRHSIQFGSNDSIRFYSILSVILGTGVTDMIRYGVSKHECMHEKK